MADVFVVWAKTDNEEIRGFILERSMAGLTTPYVVSPSAQSRHPEFVTLRSAIL